MNWDGQKAHGNEPESKRKMKFTHIDNTIMLICSEFWSFALFTLMNLAWNTMTI